MNIAGVANFGASTTSPTGRDADTYEGSVTGSFYRGSLLWKAGVDTLYNRLNISFPGSQLAPVYSFSSLADVPSRPVHDISASLRRPDQFQSNPNFAAFVQDEWKPFENITLNVGVRYEMQQMPSPIRLDTE